MTALDGAVRYFDAWNRRDPEAIAATFAPEGTYADPALPDGLDPKATGEYAARLFAAFSDLAFEIASVGEGGEGTVAARW